MAFGFSFKYYLFCLQADFHLKSRSMWAACHHIIRFKRSILQCSSFTCPGGCHAQICSCSLVKRRVELWSIPPVLIHSFIQQVFIECLLCARHCHQALEIDTAVKTDKVPALVELTF